MSRIKAWIKALRGFYDKKEQENDVIARLLFSARSVILIISAQAAIIAGILAYASNSFNLVNFFLTLLGFVSLHAVSNLSNDYFGYIRGHDKPDSPRRAYTLHPLADGILGRRQMQVTILSLILFSLSIGAYLTIVRGLVVLIFLTLGLLILYLYDAAPKPLKQIGLGEIASFIVWGPIMIVGGYYAISGLFSLQVMLYSIPYGLGVMTILLGKHIDQQNYDKENGIRTLPVIIGERNARILVIIVIALMYAISFFPLTYGEVPLLGIVLLFNLPTALRTLKILSTERPDRPPEGYVGWPLWYHRTCLNHNRRFGWLYIAGLLLLSIISQVTKVHL